MSRSYAKRTKNLTNVSGMKRIANKTVRRKSDIQSGKSYRKVFNSYNINDGWGPSVPIWVLANQHQWYFNNVNKMIRK